MCPLVCKNGLLGDFAVLSAPKRTERVLAICKKCRSRFVSENINNTDICPECITARDIHDLKVIARYLEGHPHDTLIDISCSTGITMTRLRTLFEGGPLDRRSKPRQ